MRIVKGAAWKTLRSQVFERDGFICQYCGAKGGLHCDHMQPITRGGTDDIENLVTACLDCNLTKRNKTVAEFLAGNSWISYLVKHQPERVRILSRL